MTALNDILAQLPIDQLANQLGADEQVVREAAGPAVTSLLGGLTQNAQDPAGAQALAGALNEHANRGLLDGGVSLEQVDQTDGEKILGHVFGDRTEGVAQALGAQTGASGSLFQKLLPLLAPIVLSYLGKQLSGRGGAAGDILGQVLGGAGQGAQVPAGAQDNLLGGILSNVLGQVLGGGQAQGNPFDPSNAAPTANPGQGDIVSQILGGLLGKK